MKNKKRWTSRKRVIERLARDREFRGDIDGAKKIRNKLLDKQDSTNEK